MPHVGKLLLEWDDWQVLEDIAAALREEDPTLSDDEALQLASAEQDQQYWAWEDFLTALQELLDQVNPASRPWHAEVVNFGWRELTGHKEFPAGRASEFLRAILPATDCSFRIHGYGRRGLAIQNFHHDSPVGKEWYYIDCRARAA